MWPLYARRKHHSQLPRTKFYNTPVKGDRVSGNAIGYLMMAKPTMNRVSRQNRQEAVQVHGYTPVE